MASNQKFDTVLLIPMYNPPSGWEQTFLERYNSFCQQLGHSIPVVLSNDGSTRDLRAETNFLQEHIGDNFFCIHAEKNKGKGAALKSAAALLEADFYLFTDVDFPYSAESMVQVAEDNKKQGGIAMGVRQQTYYDDINVFRTYLSKILKWLNRLILQLPSNDTQCGLKAFDAEARACLLQCKTNRFLIDLEFLLAAQKQKINIRPVEVRLRQDIQFTNFNSMVLMKELLNFIQIVFRYRFPG